MKKLLAIFALLALSVYFFGADAPPAHGAPNEGTCPEITDSAYYQIQQEKR